MSLVFVHSHADFRSKKIGNEIFVLGMSLICHVAVMHLGLQVNNEPVTSSRQSSVGILQILLSRKL